MHRVLTAVVALVALGGAVHTGTAGAATTPKQTPTKGVVLVNTNLGLENGTAAGTGIVLTKTGEVMTNNHVIAGATSIKVTVPATKRSYVADVIGYDIADDVALLQLEKASSLATVTVGSSSRLKIGQATRAVGNANGAGKLVVANGKILAVNQTISVQQDDGEVTQLGSVIATSSHLVPGDSGGPLLNSAGRVIGMDAAGSASGNATNSPGFAISINHAMTVMKQIAALRASTVIHIGATAFMGVTLQDTANGVVIGSVISGSPAATGGLVNGEVLTSIDGTSLSSFTDVRSILFSHHPGDQITIGYTDTAGAAQTATITLASGPPQ